MVIYFITRRYLMHFCVYACLKTFSDVLESLDKAMFGLRDLNAETLLLKYLLSKKLFITQTRFL